jgi:hypothetical protein
MAVVRHRYEWLYVYGFVKPKTGETLWYLIPRVNTKWLNIVYENFAKDAEISGKKKILLVEDNAGWHRSQKVTSQKLEVKSQKFNLCLKSEDSTDALFFLLPHE